MPSFRLEDIHYSFHAVNRISKSQFWGGRWIYRFSKNLILDFVWKHIFVRIYLKKVMFLEIEILFRAFVRVYFPKVYTFPKVVGTKNKDDFFGKVYIRLQLAYLHFGKSVYWFVHFWGKRMFFFLSFVHSKFYGKSIYTYVGRFWEFYRCTVFKN